MIAATVRSHDAPGGLTLLDFAGGTLRVPHTDMPVGKTLRVRVRARDVSVSLAPVDGLSIRNQIPATVTAVEAESGAFAEIRLDCDGQALRARISRMALDDLAITPGDRVWALIKSIAFDRRLIRG